MRPGQNNFKNRNRNRNRRHGGGGNGGGGGGGGNSNNRVLDSNGPDVKLRGTAQTIAEKYMQLARDAHSSGDRVMAESYYQHADHYYRVWLAAQPVGQPVHFPRRLDEDVEDLEGGEGEDEGNSETAQGEQQDVGEAAGGTGEGTASDGEPGEDGQQNQNRNLRNREQGNRDQGNRDQSGGGRERFRNRWPRRNERSPDQQDGGIAPAPEAQGEDAGRPERVERTERPERAERAPRRERADVAPVAEATGDWEAPSFLKRPMPVVAEDAGDAAAAAPVAAERRPRARRPRYGEEGVTPNEPPIVSED